jgi:hypothetical protein
MLRNIINAKNPDAGHARESAINFLHNNSEKLIDSHYTGSDILGSKHLSDKDVDDLWNTGNHNVRLAMGANPKLGDARLHKLIDDHKNSSYTAVKGAVMKNPKAKSEHVARLLGKEKYYDEDLLDDKRIGNDEMNKIYHANEDHFVRQFLLGHPKATQSMISHAVADRTKHGVLSSAPAALPSVLDSLHNSPMRFVRYNVAKHKNTTKETLRKMQQDSDPEIQEIANKRGK